MDRRPKPKRRPTDRNLILNDDAQSPGDATLVASTPLTPTKEVSKTLFKQFIVANGSLPRHVLHIKAHWPCAPSPAEPVGSWFPAERRMHAISDTVVSEIVCGTSSSNPRLGTTASAAMLADVV